MRLESVAALIALEKALGAGIEAQSVPILEDAIEELDGLRARGGDAFPPSSAAFIAEREAEARGLLGRFERERDLCSTWLGYLGQCSDGALLGTYEESWSLGVLEALSLGGFESLSL